MFETNFIGIANIFNLLLLEPFKFLSKCSRKKSTKQST